MIEQHPLKEQASTTYDQPPLINLASAANNNDKQMLPKHLAPVATVPNTIPLWFGFTHEHMEYSLSLLPLSELQQATRKCVNTCEDYRRPKEFQIKTILAHFDLLRSGYLPGHKECSVITPELAAFNFFSDALTESVVRCLMLPPCFPCDIPSPFENELIIPCGPNVYYNKRLLATIVKRLHPLRQPTNAPSSFSFKDLSQFVVQSICQCIGSLHNNSQTVDIVSVN
jgi:hypothetical protein